MDDINLGIDGELIKCLCEFTLKKNMHSISYNCYSENIFQGRGLRHEINVI